MAWIREIEVTISNAATTIIISSLNLSFNIERTIETSPNTCNLTIYNAKKETQDKILKKGSVVKIKAGYRDEKNTGNIFFGKVTKTVSYTQGMNRVTELSCQDLGNNNEKLQYTTIGVSYAAKTPLSSVITELANLLSVPIAGIENVTRTLNNGWNYSGSITGAVNQLKNTLRADDIGLFFDQNEMVLYQLNQGSSKFGIVRITKDSGLIESVADITDENEEDDKKRYAFKTLLNPKIRPLTIINLSTSKVNGTFFVEKCSYVGDNFGGEFYCEVEVAD